jgi:predicted GIY-YIG superfamily endonuclease
MDSFFVYITVNCKNEIQDIGVTIDINRRFHFINKKSQEFNKACKLVYYEEYCNSEEAINRENQLNNLHSSLLQELIKDNNPAYANLIGEY